MWLAYSSISLWAENLGLQDELPFVEDLIAGPTISFRKTHSKFHETTVAETVASFDCFLYKRDPSSTFWASHHSLVRSFCREPFVSIRCSVRPEKAASFQVVQKHDFIFKIGLSISISIVNIWFEDLCESFRIPPITLCHTGILFWKPRSWVFGENSSCVCVVSSRTIIGSTEVFSASESQWIPVIWKEIVWTISALLGLVGAQSNPQQITRTPIDPSWGLDMLWISI